MPTDKPITVRLPQALLRDLAGLSIVDGGTLADQIRTAASEYVARRKSAPDFLAKVEAARARQDEALAILTAR